MGIESHRNPWKLMEFPRNIRLFQHLVPCEKKFLSMFALILSFFSPSDQFFSMAETSSIRDGSDYGSDVLTDFESEMFCGTTSKTTDKSTPLAGTTRNVATRQGEIAKAPQPMVGCPGQQKKNGNGGAQGNVT